MRFMIIDNNGAEITFGDIVDALRFAEYVEADTINIQTEEQSGKWLTLKRQYFRFADRRQAYMLFQHGEIIASIKMEG